MLTKPNVILVNPALTVFWLKEFQTRNKIVGLVATRIGLFPAGSLYGGRSFAIRNWASSFVSLDKFKMTVAEGKSPEFSFGLVADIQYADKEIGSYEGRFQRYREVPKKLAIAVDYFNFHKHDLLFALSLGDIIDGNETAEKSEEDFEVVMTHLSKLDIPIRHVLGNHCLAMPRAVLLQRLAMPSCYYDVELKHGWRLVVLDSMDMSVHTPQDSPIRKEADAFLEEHPCGEQNPQMFPWNGGIGSLQRAWLANILQTAHMKGERLIVAMHHPLVTGSAPATYLVWNHAQIMEMLVLAPSVVLVLAGHYHVGGYAQVDGLHFVTVEAILEAPADSIAHGVVHVYQDHVEIVGSGVLRSRVLNLRDLRPAAI